MVSDPLSRHGLRPRPYIRDSARRWQEDGRWELSMEQRERIKAAKKKAYGLHVSLKKARKIYNRTADAAAIFQSRYFSWYKLQSRYFISLGSKPNHKDKCVD